MNATAVETLVPILGSITEVREETHDVRTLRLDLADSEEAESFTWRAGQFVMVSVFGAGESALTITNPPAQKGFIEVTFRQMGTLTSALRRPSEGEPVGLRGPYGNSFPVEEWRGRDIAFVGGGIGMAAVHAPLWDVLGNREAYGEITVMAGAKTVADLVYRNEAGRLRDIPGVRVIQVVDPGGEEPGWDGEVGLIPQVFERMGLSGRDTTVVVCGPPVMLGFMLQATTRMGTPPSQVITTLENRMKCGVGYCGHCNVGEFMVCRDGPVVSGEVISQLPNEF